MTDEEQPDFSRRTEPPPEIDGAALLDRVKAQFVKFCVLPSEHDAVAVVLWVAYTHLITAFEFAPRLIARSATKRSGKSRLLEVLTEMVHDPLQTVSVTTAYIFRSIDEDNPPTLVFDEADTQFGTQANAERNEELRALLNAGFRKGNKVGRTVGPMHVPTEFSVFAPAAVAGIGRMPDTVEDRAVIVHMKRRKQSETVTKFRMRRDTGALHVLRDELAEWAASIRERIAECIPEDMPVDDRAADVWEPLIAVADFAGGSWPEAARLAAKELSHLAAVDDSDSESVQLLTDIRSVFADMPGVTFLHSKVLCDKLAEIDGGPWADLTQTKLGMALRDFQIRAKRSTTGDRKRGYFLADFQDTFERWITTGEEP